MAAARARATAKRGSDVAPSLARRRPRDRTPLPPTAPTTKAAPASAPSQSQRTARPWRSRPPGTALALHPHASGTRWHHHDAAACRSAMTSGEPPCAAGTPHRSWPRGGVAPAAATLRCNMLALTSAMMQRGALTPATRGRWRRVTRASATKGWRWPAARCAVDAAFGLHGSTRG